jgi:hypothetical protein
VWLYWICIHVLSKLGFSSLIAFMTLVSFSNQPLFELIDSRLVILDCVLHFSLFCAYSNDSFSVTSTSSSPSHWLRVWRVLLILAFVNEVRMLKVFLSHATKSISHANYWPHSFLYIKVCMT